MNRLRLREPFSGLSHLAGAALSAAGLLVLVWLSRGKPWHLAGFAIYGASLVFLYLASACYHLLPVGPERVRRLLVLDQVAIYALIAGTYTPICLVSLREPSGWGLCGLVWGIALAGSAIRVGCSAAPAWLCVVLYLAMGWLSLTAFSPILRALTGVGAGWLLLGGILYTVGCVVFATQRPRLWPGVFGSHDLWHVFVLAGSACHFVVMLYFVAPLP